MTIAQSESRSRWSLETLFKRLGPGVITGAADDDPSGIATYSQAGAQTGFGLLWTVVLTFPLMVAVQSVSARIGRVTGLGIAGNLRRHYSAWGEAALRLRGSNRAKDHGHHAESLWRGLLCDGLEASTD